MGMTATILITAAHLWALGELESGNNDHKIGPRKEVTRYQITPKLWNKSTTHWGEHPPSPSCYSCASAIAAGIWRTRQHAFESSHGRQPTDFELAILWHCPARMSKTTKSDRDYATRFVNLVALAKAKIPTK